MLRSAAERLHQHLLQAFPPTQAYPRAVFERPPMPGLIGHFLGRTLDARLESFGRIPRSEWYDVDAPVVQRTLEAWHSALLTTARIPAGDWSDALDQAVRLVLVYLVRPAQTLTAFIFGNDEHPVEAELVLARMQYFDAYLHLHKGVERYLDDEGLREFNRTPFLNLITRLDRAHTVGFEPEDWMALLQPLFDLVRIAPPAEQPGIPVDILQLFFEQKGETEILRGLDELKSAQGVVALDEDGLRHVLRSPRAPLALPPDVPTLPAPPAPPETPSPHPADRPAPTSEPLDEETETPLWMKYRREQAAADRERKGIAILRRSDSFDEPLADEPLADEPGPADPKTVKPEDIVEPVAEEPVAEEPVADESTEVVSETVEESAESWEVGEEASDAETAASEFVAEPGFETEETAVSEGPETEEAHEDESDESVAYEDETYEGEATEELEQAVMEEESAVDTRHPDETDAAFDAPVSVEGQETAESEPPVYEEEREPPVDAEEEEGDSSVDLEEALEPPAMDEPPEPIEADADEGISEAEPATEARVESDDEAAAAPDEAEPERDAAYDEVQAWLAAGVDSPTEPEPPTEPTAEPEAVVEIESEPEPASIPEPLPESAADEAEVELEDAPETDAEAPVLQEPEVVQEAEAPAEEEGREQVVVTEDETLLPVEAFPVGKRAPLPDDPAPDAPDAETEETPGADAPIPLWQRLQHQLGSGTTLAAQAAQGKRSPTAPATPESTSVSGDLAADEERNMRRIERALLGRVDEERRSMFIDHLFGGSRADYLDVLEALERCTSWPEASRVIAGRVFRKHNVNIYSEPAIEFTDVLEAHFRRGRSRE